MTALDDLTGRRFGKWKVIERLPRRGNMTMWKCRCDCGTEAPVQGSSLKNGGSTQCTRCRADSMRKR